MADETCRTFAAAQSPSLPRKGISASERRKALRAWLDRVEAQVKQRLQDLSLPQDMPELKEHLPRLLNLHPTDATVVLPNDSDPQQTYQRGYDLLCCLACLRNCRELLNRKEPEWLVFQAYYLGIRANKANVRVAEKQAYDFKTKTRAAGKQSGKSRREDREPLRKDAERFFKQAREAGHTREAAYRFAGRKLKPNKSARTVRRWLTGK